MRHALFLLLLAAAPAFAQSPLPPIDEPRGSLVIVGGGTFPDAIREKFVALAGGEKAKIVVIPTASADADDATKRDSFTASWTKLKPASVTILHTRDRKQVDDIAFVKPLTEATAVWFSGGDQNRILTVYRGTRVEKELHKLLERRGVIGGTSAGAAIMGDPMIAGGKDKATTATGFGFLPGFIVDQHFVARNRKERLIGVIDGLPGYVGLGIDEGTAAIVTRRDIEVLGESTVTVILSPGAGKPRLETVLKAKESADLFQLRRAAANRAAKVAFPPAKLAEANVANGTLVIIGGGGTTVEIMDRFFAAAGGKDALILAIPTANEFNVVVGETGDEKFLKKYGATNVKRLHTRSRTQADDPKFSEILTEAKGVWFGGGRQWRFVDAYENTLIEKRFHEVLARGGVIGGSSAGASIQSEYMPRGHPLGNEVMAAEGYEKGFGFLPGCAVDQHFFARKRFADMTGLMKLYPQYLGIGIDESTAIVIAKQIAEVVGNSKVAFYDANAKPVDGKDYVEVSAGRKYDLKTRKVVE